jgi:hypothetical protein
MRHSMTQFWFVNQELSMNRILVAIAALACLSTASSAENCWNAKQNWNSGNTRTCAFDGKRGTDVVEAVVTEQPMVEEEAPVDVTEVTQTITLN